MIFAIFPVFVFIIHLPGHVLICAAKGLHGLDNLEMKTEFEDGLHFLASDVMSATLFDSDGNEISFQDDKKSVKIELRKKVLCPYECATSLKPFK